MDIVLQIVSIIISVMLIIMVLLQVKGGGLGASLFGGDAGGGIARTRRGLEKTLFQITIGLSVVFIAIAILAVSYSR